MNSKANDAVRLIKKYSGLLAVLLAMVVIVTVSNPRFIGIDNIIAVFRQISIYGVMGVGMAILIINGYFDLSVGSMAGLCGVLAALVMNHGGNALMGVLTAVIVGIVIGVFNGAIVCYTGIPAFVFTLAMTQILRGAIYLITNGNPVTGITEGFLEINGGDLFGIPIPIYIMFIIMFLGWILMNHTTIGRSIYATGGKSYGRQIFRDPDQQDHVVQFRTLRIYRGSRRDHSFLETAVRAAYDGNQL